MQRNTPEQERQVVVTPQFKKKTESIHFFQGTLHGFFTGVEILTWDTYILIPRIFNTHKYLQLKHTGTSVFMKNMLQ
jgi:hypothetical protein